ncbi:hypothetical protein EXT70_26895, partial [Dickeya dadantii]|nr:hypothetical protein [Dickeya dadantii]
ETEPHHLSRQSGAPIEKLRSSSVVAYYQRKYLTRCPSGGRLGLSIGGGVAMARKYLWSGRKCRDFWCTRYTSSRRPRVYEVGEFSYWASSRGEVVRQVIYRRTAIHGLREEEVKDILQTSRRNCDDWHTRRREDGLLDLFHIKRVRDQIISRTYGRRDAI